MIEYSDTLKYFFSSVFQGFAALITLGAMFFLYYFERMNSRKEDLEGKMMEELWKISNGITNMSNDNRKYLFENGMVRLIEDKLIRNDTGNEKYLPAQILIKDFNYSQNKIKETKRNIPKIVVISFSILGISLFSLILINTSYLVNIVLIIIALIIIIFSIIDFIFIIKLIYHTLELKNE